jgi:hypothetical protein
MTETVASYMGAALCKSGVKRIDGIVGDSLNGFTDALRRKRSNGSTCVMRRARHSQLPVRRM